MHFNFLIFVLVFMTGYTEAQNCTSTTCSVYVVYISSVLEDWFVSKRCPPGLYSGINDTVVAENTDFSRVYYVRCYTCYEVVGDFASCWCLVGLVEPDNYYYLTCDMVETRNTLTVVTPLSITTQTTATRQPVVSPVTPVTSSTIQTQTLTQIPLTISSTVTTISTSESAQNATLETRQETSGLILVSTVPLLLIAALACIIVILVIVLLIVYKRRTKMKPVVASEPVYTEIGNTYNSLPLYMQMSDVSHGYYSPMTLLSSDGQESVIYQEADEDIVQGFSSNVSELNEDVYEYISEKLNRDYVTDDPWFEKDIQMRRMGSQVNSSGTLSCLKVPSYIDRNTQHTDTTGFEHYGNATCTEEIENSCENSSMKIFSDPPDTNIELYDRMSGMKLREINPETVKLNETLGTGEFGSVIKAVWNSPLGETHVAIKVLKEMKDDASGEKIQTAFLQEAAILGQLSHPNILRLVGVVTLTVPNMIVTELMYEELKRFLVALQRQHNQDLDYQIMAPHFLSFSRHVANGMQYLAERGCIHRDIAARNILLTDNCVCKIADFGMSRRLEAESDYYRVKGSNKMPVKWSAPEAVFFKRYTLKSDVWSYGMLLYEIWSVGRKPWPYEDNKSTVEKMARGVNLPPPAGCPRAIYEIMVTSWHPQADQRPDMKYLVTLLNESDDNLLDRG
eukprot:TRINITY_DN4657_c0_g1_i2.p1 TRINITY_DN4657_c0_g1~~TRINITY_DN4657_c0_g1_i2.p1  ORF type:complete len:679 (+),score=113.17 TRINITY_DN4657_c0_g1_i2:1-2037(+)